MNSTDMVAIKEARHSFLTDLHGAETREALGSLLSHHIFERTPAVFNGNRAAWIDWKTKLAAGLEVDPLSLVLVGGAALGFSPIADLHYFRPQSDVDVAVISPRHFDSAWHRLRSYNHYPSEMRRVLKEHCQRYIYWGIVATDLTLACFEFGDHWTAVLQEMRNESATLNREINVRIYRDPASLRTYQIVGLRGTQRALRRKDFREAFLV